MVAAAKGRSCSFKSRSFKSCSFKCRSFNCVSVAASCATHRSVARLKLMLMFAEFDARIVDEVASAAVLAQSRRHHAEPDFFQQLPDHDGWNSVVARPRWNSSR